MQPLTFDWLPAFLQSFFAWLSAWQLVPNVNMTSFLVALGLMFVFIRAVLLKG